MEIIKNENDITLSINGQFAGKLTLVKQDASTYKIPLVYVDPAFRGQKLGSVLMEEVVKWARQNNYKLVPVCPYAAHEFSKNLKYKDVLYI